MQRIWEITVTLDFIFWLMLCSHADVSFNIICLNVLEGIKQFNTEKESRLGLVLGVQNSEFQYFGGFSVN